MDVSRSARHLQLAVPPGRACWRCRSWRCARWCTWAAWRTSPWSSTPRVWSTARSSTSSEGQAHAQPPAVGGLLPQRDERITQRERGGRWRLTAPRPTALMPSSAARALLPPARAVCSPWRRWPSSGPAPLRRISSSRSPWRGSGWRPSLLLRCPEAARSASAVRRPSCRPCVPVAVLRHPSRPWPLPVSRGDVCRCAG